MYFAFEPRLFLESTLPQVLQHLQRLPESQLPAFSFISLSEDVAGSTLIATT